MPHSVPDRSLLLRYGGFAAVTASAGIPLYVHLPAFLAERYGIGLGALGGLLLVMRLIDFGQDPALGWLLSRLGRWREVVVVVTLLVLGAGMAGLFAVPAPGGAAMVWVIACLVLTFSGFSMLTILIYADGVARGRVVGHLGVATWREAGTLVGITAACILPFALPGDGYRGFAGVFVAALALAGWGMRGRWLPVRTATPDFRSLLGDPVLRRFLLLAFLNAAPVAVTSTLFLFFVEARLQLPGEAGLFLVLFFLAAAASTPAWRTLAGRFGARRMLALGMVLAMASFVWAGLLGPGDRLAFAVICLASGAALGADMMLLPALFSAHQGRDGGDPALAFGLWNFAGKATLAVSAGVVLPILGWAGFQPGQAAPPGALDMLAVLYAVLPCALKVAALGLLLFGFRRGSFALSNPE